MFSEFQILGYENNMFQGCSHISLYVLKNLGDKCGVRGSRFGNRFGRSRNVPKNIAIDQKSLINHFELIKIPKRKNLC